MFSSDSRTESWDDIQQPGKLGMQFLRQTSLPPKRTLWSHFFLRQPVIPSYSIYFPAVSAMICFANGALSDTVLVSSTSSRKEAFGNDTSHKADPATLVACLTVNKHMVQICLFHRGKHGGGKLSALSLHTYILTCNTSACAYCLCS